MRAVGDPVSRLRALDRAFARGSYATYLLWAWCCCAPVMLGYAVYLAVERAVVFVAECWRKLRPVVCKTRAQWLADRDSLVP